MLYLKSAAIYRDSSDYHRRVDKVWIRRILSLFAFNNQMNIPNLIPNLNRIIRVRTFPLKFSILLNLEIKWLKQVREPFAICLRGG